MNAVNILNDVVCPVCHSALTRDLNNLLCHKCKVHYYCSERFLSFSSDLVEKFEQYQLSTQLSQYRSANPSPPQSFYSDFIPSNGSLILDAGGGDGNATASFAKKNPNSVVYVTDADIGALHKVANRRIDNLIPLQCDITKLPFRDDSFDFIMCVFVVEHMRPHVLSEFLQEIYRVLKPGGQFLVSTDTSFYDKYIHPFERLVREKKWMTSGWTHKEGVGHVNLMYPRQAEKILLSEGFKIKSRHIHFLAGRYRIMRKIFSILPSLSERFCSTIFIFICNK